MDYSQELRKLGVRDNVSLKGLTTLKMGGPARYFVLVRKEGELVKLLKLLRSKKQKFYVLGEGSDIVASDRGYKGVLVKIAIDGVKVSGREAWVGAGTNLLKFIDTVNFHGLAGMERMAGIPGTVGGAIYGNAGAYGQEIKDHLKTVRFFDPAHARIDGAGGQGIRELPKEKLKLSYRTSVFKKHKNWIILGAEFEFKKAEAAKLKKTSKEVIALRQEKYKPGLKCPGSFFKNIVLADLPAQQCARLVAKVPADKVIYGKIPAGYLLEAVGAKGIRRGGIRIAPHHANLFYNAGGGKAADIKYLARVLKGRVKRKFGVILEEEVQYLS